MSRKDYTDIPPEVKRAVYERDKGKCVVCLKNNGIPESHYIRRSHGGLGIEENIVCLCRECHRRFDDGDMREQYGLIIERYLKSKYERMG